MNTLTQPLKWHGGKGAFRGKLARWIISLMPPHIHYVEPYFGGGSVLLHKDPEGVSEVVNDVDGQLMDFWKTLKDDTQLELLQRRLEATPFSEEEWEGYEEILAGLASQPPYVRAALFFVRYRQSRQGLGKDFATLSRNRTRRGMNEQVSSWLTAIEGLPEIHARLKRVVILNDDALNVIRQQDGLKTLFYVDAPYIHSTRQTTKEYGAHEMSDAQHETLIELMVGSVGKFAVSMYRHPIYDQLHLRHGWSLYEKTLPNNASSSKTKKKMTECLWVRS